MNIESFSGSAVTQRDPQALVSVDRQRKATEKAVEDFVPVAEDKVAPEELVNQIKALSENGVYSVRFENDDTIDEMVVKVVDRETDEVIRQIPPEELIAIMKNLRDIRGGIIDTVG